MLWSFMHCSPAPLGSYSSSMLRCLGHWHVWDQDRHLSREEQHFFQIFDFIPLNYTAFACNGNPHLNLRPPPSDLWPPTSLMMHTSLTLSCHSRALRAFRAVTASGSEGGNLDELQEGRSFAVRLKAECSLGCARSLGRRRAFTGHVLCDRLLAGP